MPFIFPILINKEFFKAYYFIPIYILSAFFNVIQGLYSVVYIALKKTKDIAKTTMLAAIINLVVHIVCIRWIGMYAAAVSSVVSYLIISVYRYYDIKKYVNVPINKQDVGIIIVIFAVAFITYLLYAKYASKWSCFNFDICILRIFQLEYTWTMCKICNKKNMWIKCGRKYDK